MFGYHLDPKPSKPAKLVVSVNAVNSVHGRHFVLVEDGRLRASCKIMGWEEGVGMGWNEILSPKLVCRASCGLGPLAQSLFLLARISSFWESPAQLYLPGRQVVRETCLPHTRTHLLRASGQGFCGTLNIALNRFDFIFHYNDQDRSFPLSLTRNVTSHRSG